jgi:hypothetical protein
LSKIFANIQTPLLTYQQRINAFVQLGLQLDILLNAENSETSVFSELLNTASVQNVWFTPAFIKHSLKQFRSWLYADSLHDFTEPYFKATALKPQKTIAVICAGNIPLVCIHDVLCVLLSGHNLLLKPSKEDTLLPLFVLQLLNAIEPAFSSQIRIAEIPMKHFDALIATGSTTSARQFEFYFSKYPRIIRKSKSSIAVLDGTETDADLELLMQDVFTYFGLGCRSVNLLCVPVTFDLQRLFKASLGFEYLSQHHAYMNQYDYQRSLLMLEGNSFLENNIFILKASEHIFAPVSVLHYKLYDSEKQLKDFISLQQDDLQCIVSKTHIPFGNAQTPHLNDFADNVNTMNFLQT